MGWRDGLMIAISTARYVGATWAEVEEFITDVEGEFEWPDKVDELKRMGLHDG